jgi:hypothetical protein
MNEPEINLEAIKELAQDFIKQQTVIWSSTRYYNQSGLAIDKREIAHGDRPEDFAEYIAYGTAELKYDLSDIPQGVKPPPKQSRFAVAIEAKTIIEAFEKAPEILESEAGRIQEQFSKDIEESKKNIINARESEKLRRKLLGGA